MADATPRVLTVAGSDPSGGAGLQLDLRVMQAHGVQGLAAVTGITVQDAGGVRAVEPVQPSLLSAQIDAALSEGVAAAKSGMVVGALCVESLAAAVRRDATLPWVVDPILAPTRGVAFLDEAAKRAFEERLLPAATLLTPNRHEAEWLSGQPIATIQQAETAARRIVDRGAQAVLVKGGHLAGERVADVLYADGIVHVFEAQRVSVDCRGTGCALSAAIASHLAHNRPLPEAVGLAHDWLQQALLRTAATGEARPVIDFEGVYLATARGTGKGVVHGEAPN